MEFLFLGIQTSLKLFFALIQGVRRLKGEFLGVGRHRVLPWLE
jgi:hypothetical protein